MKTNHNYYSNVPCLGRDCKHWGGEYQEETLIPRGYDTLGLGIWNNEERLVIWHGEHCNKSCELAKIRKEIYDRALEASDNIHESNKYKSIHTEIRKASNAFDKIADEWRNMKCPYYERQK